MSSGLILSPNFENYHKIYKFICERYNSIYVYGDAVYYNTMVMSARIYLVLTHWSRDNMAAIFQTTFSYAFSWMKMYEYRLKFHWSFSLGV